MALLCTVLSPLLSHAQLMQELKWHNGLVNSLVYCGRGHVLYSGDSQGRVGVWGEEQGEGILQQNVCVDEPL